MPAPTTTAVVSDYERERRKPMPSKLHSITQRSLIMALDRYHECLTSFSELSPELDGHQFTPDLSINPYIEIDYTEDEARLTEPPLAAIVIASPTQGVQALVEKIRTMLEVGVQSCWLVQPLLQTVTAFTDDGKHTVREGAVREGAVRDPATDVEVDLVDVFRA